MDCLKWQSDGQCAGAETDSARWMACSGSKRTTCGGGGKWMTCGRVKGQCGGWREREKLEGEEDENVQREDEIFLGEGAPDTWLNFG